VGPALTQILQPRAANASARATPKEADPCALYLKLENLQLSGSFKIRGALNYARALTPEAIARGLITASGGNHGLGVAALGRVAAAPVTIFVPRTTPSAKIAALKRWGATVELHGQVWDDANERALATAASRGLTYIHPFEPPELIAGQGTIALEILEDLPDIDTLVIALGGGGLLSGIAVAAKALRPQLRVIGVEPTGAPTLTRSLAAGEVIELERVETRAVTLAPRRSAPRNLHIIKTLVDEIVLVDDDEMTRAASWLWNELGVAAELSAAAGIAALTTGKIELCPGEKICALICGAGTAGLP
jgi:threonine dehydratase